MLGTSQTLRVLVSIVSTIATITIVVDTLKILHRNNQILSTCLMNVIIIGVGCTEDFTSFYNIYFFKKNKKA